MGKRLFIVNVVKANTYYSLNWHYKYTATVHFQSPLYPIDI